MTPRHPDTTTPRYTFAFGLFLEMSPMLGINSLSLNMTLFAVFAPLRTLREIIKPATITPPAAERGKK